MNIDVFLTQLRSKPESISFNQTMELINQQFDYTPSRFSNGPELINEAGTNEGSCKIFSFAQLMQLDVNETLQCFGDYYREEVLKQPEANNHGNIRAFIVNGWDGIRFDHPALKAKV